MAILRLGICVAGVYSMFLIWAIAQEKLSLPFESVDGTPAARFKYPMVMSTCQSLGSVVSSFVYLLLRRKKGQSLASIVGLELQKPTSNGTANGTANGHSNSHANGHANGSAKHSSVKSKHLTSTSGRNALLLRYLQCATFVTFAAPFGFAALSHISYPTMVLGKSCKLIPVMIMNVLLYRRRFAPHKYLVVALVTLGITMFMLFGNAKAANSHAAKAKAKTESQSGALGLLLLLINLAIDGATNSTQDEIFTRYAVTGQQMMLFINIFSAFITLPLVGLPLPHIPIIHPSTSSTPELFSALAFINSHVGVLKALLMFAFTGALGQLFIFETLQHFGSLTLVTITLTRKLFTMILSVIVYGHKLTLGQWGGAAVVFAGISVEAWVKRKEVHAKRVIQEKEKAKIKDL